MARVRIEFLGIPRERAGLAELELDVIPATLGELLKRASLQLPQFGGRCVAGDRLKPGLVVNVNGRRFVSDPATALTDGDCVLILSADVGG